MPYLVPICICGSLQIIVLLLFIFCSEETLSKKELDANRMKVATIDVLTILMNNNIERIE